MRVTVDDVELFFDVDGAALVPDRNELRTRPTLLLLHGGPGTDHTMFKPFLSPLADAAQLVYLDLRGQGRSKGDDPADWNLETWARDVRGFCDVVGIDRPVVLGASFGSFVALRYAIDFPEHPQKLVLLEAAARFVSDRVVSAFGRLHGAAPSGAAAQFFRTPSERSHAVYRSVCHPLYAHRSSAAQSAPHSTARPEVSRHFFAGEAKTFDLRTAAAGVGCPVLIVNGRDDPVTTVEAAVELAEALPADATELVLVDDAAHDLSIDAPSEVLRHVRRFLSAP